MSGVRGYADWTPQIEARVWVQRTRAVLDAYRDYWPLTCRQIFYRLVAEHDYAKTEQSYNRLTTMISRARRAGMLPWEAIRDGGLGRTVAASFFTDEDSFYEAIARAIDGFKLDRQDGQDAIVELWCEAGGMVPILQRIGRPYGARVNTGGGYDSVTAKHNLALRVRSRARVGQRTIILHVGDFDGSGEDMANTLHEDVAAMVALQVYQHVPDLGPERDDDNPDERLAWAVEHFTLNRVALTAQQVLDRGVETAPAKATDSRTTEFLARNAWLVDELGTTQISAQLEALTPPELNDLIGAAIEDHLDMDVYRERLSEEQPIRDSLRERLADVLPEVDDDDEAWDDD